MRNHFKRKEDCERGFALVATLSLMVLLSILAVGLLSLSAVSLRSSSQGSAQAEARANARLALMIAIGELQKEMGPDMRISAEAAIFDQNPKTEAPDGVAQPRWLASYDSWGNWLNADYAPPGKSALPIRETYAPKRERMFRRWLLSMPAGSESNVNAADSLSGWNDSNSVVLVGDGSLGKDFASSQPGQVTRAYLTRVDAKSRNAWWISPENHKARIDMAKRPRPLASAAFENSQGDTAEVGVGQLEGFGALEANAGLAEKLITEGTLVPANVDGETAKGHFFDLTASSRGVVASVRSGHLKKDLSLLFEKGNSASPAMYRYQTGAEQEPSIRPMSPDLLARNPKVGKRHFQSWTNMRYFYRMYRRDVGTTRGAGTPDSLEWSGTTPYARAQMPILYRDRSKVGQWHGDNAYYRLPVLAKLTFIYSLKSERVNPASTTDLRYRLLLVYTPVYTYWNPYNTVLRIPDNTLGCLSSTYQVLPMRTQFYLGNTAQGTQPGDLLTGNAHSFLRSGNGGDIIFNPGEIKLFAHKTIGSQSGGQAVPLDLEAGFNPMAYGGDRLQVGVRNSWENPGLAVLFSHSVWGGNVSYGNTPGSLCHTPFWLMDSQRILAYNWNFPAMCQNDWFNLAQTYTPMTPDPLPDSARVASQPQHIARWVFTDSNPVPVGYAQLVLKGLSEFDHEGLAWKKDWRCRNWIQAPPFYFGNALYISEDEETAHTQRLDNSYVMNFGPMSMAEMGKVVFHVPQSDKAYLGSGTNPFEKVTSVPAIELPTAPIGSLAGFSTMRINPGWAAPVAMNSALSLEGMGGNNTSKGSLYFALAKTMAYQSGVTGPGVGNSFVHPMIPRTDVYGYFNNSVSADPADRRYPLDNINYNDNKVFCDFWDHVFLLNDSLWDDYFVSSLADQARPSDSAAESLSQNLDRLAAGRDLSNSRFVYEPGGKSAQTVKSDLMADEGYLKAARHLMVEGMFNVNSTSVNAWFALFAGIRERKVVYRDVNGSLQTVSIPSNKRIALSRFGTETSDQEMSDPEHGVTMPDGSKGWSGVRFLDDDQLRKLAEECVEQVKLRGPFLNYSEFINRRLSDDGLGLKGALQAAIDYDDASPESTSINGIFKLGPDFMMKASDLGDHSFATPEAAEGSRFAGIPGYVIQSDLLRPIGNTLSVRDDTFRIRAYGESLDANGNVLARAWCEAIVQRIPDYTDGANEPTVPARLLGTDGSFSDNSALTQSNRLFGRQFRVESFRWLSASEI